MRRIVASNWRGGVAEKVSACPACGSTIRHAHASSVFDNQRPDDEDLWTYWRCGSCASLFPDPRPSMDSIGAAYASYYTHHIEAQPGAASAGARRVVSRLVDGYMNSRFAAAIPDALPLGRLLFAAIEPLRLKLDYHGRHLFLASTGGRRVLDVGSGNGEFLVRARTLGWHAYGIDPDDAAVSASRDLGLVVCQGFADCAAPELGGTFDVVTLRHAIEHVPVPADDLRHCLGRLRPGGMLWLAWPNPCGLGARLFGSAWRGLEAPRHLCIPSADAMRGMLLAAGFEDPRVLRRGHHARSISRESARLAGHRPGWVNRVRARLGGVVAHIADIVATVFARGGEELVMVAFAPTSKRVP